ncbi:hypothetical protein BN871_GM_00050 [Paenibacillus sp. P22]|nr:hypothetical protein BN871_GM_00050 [Paenibacillus sp. P22]
MNLHALRLFHAVASSGSVTRAAEQLSISQPAITAQIKKFEKELALPLLQPDGRGIRLTDAGRQVKELADRLFAVERQIETLAEQYGRGDQGRLSLAATYLPANFLLPAWLAKFKQKHERVEMSVTTTNSSGALRLLQRMEADLALYGGLPEEHPDTIQAEELFQDELWFVVAPTHRHAGGSIGLDDMMREPSSCGRRAAPREKGCSPSAGPIMSLPPGSLSNSTASMKRSAPSSPVTAPASCPRSSSGTRCAGAS